MFGFGASLKDTQYLFTGCISVWIRSEGQNQGGMEGLEYGKDENGGS